MPINGLVHSQRDAKDEKSAGCKNDSMKNQHKKITTQRRAQRKRAVFQQTCNKCIEWGCFCRKDLIVTSTINATDLEWTVLRISMSTIHWYAKRGGHLLLIRGSQSMVWQTKKPKFHYRIKSVILSALPWPPTARIHPKRRKKEHACCHKNIERIFWSFFRVLATSLSPPFLLTPVVLGVIQTNKSKIFQLKSQFSENLCAIDCFIFPLCVHFTWKMVVRFRSIAVSMYQRQWQNRYNTGQVHSLLSEAVVIIIKGLFSECIAPRSTCRCSRKTAFINFYTYLFSIFLSRALAPGSFWFILKAFCRWLVRMGGD